MKKIFLIVICYILSIGNLYSQQRKEIDISPTDTLKIQYVGTETGEILIDGKVKRKGDFYIANQTVFWKNNKYYIKVTNISNKHKPFTFCNKDFKDFKVDNAYSWYFKKNHLSTKGELEGTLFSKIKRMSGVHYMIEDTVRIKSWLPIDNDHGYIATTIPGGIKFKIPCDKITNEMVITKQYLKNQVNYMGGSLNLCIEYYHKDDCKATVDDVIIEYLPRVKE